MSFIYLTDGMRSVAVRPGSIDEARRAPDGSGTTIYFDGGGDLNVSESADEVRSKFGLIPLTENGQTIFVAAETIISAVAPTTVDHDGLDIIADGPTEVFRSGNRQLSVSESLGEVMTAVSAIVDDTFVDVPINDGGEESIARATFRLSKVGYFEGQNPKLNAVVGGQRFTCLIDIPNLDLAKLGQV